MELKQEALTFARGWGADYILVRKLGVRWEALVPAPTEVLVITKPPLGWIFWRLS